MVVRALLAVLTLVGAVPLRVCTCGAAHAHVETLPATPAEHSDHADDCDPVHHDDDCGVHEPRATMCEAVPVAAADAPADHAVAPIAFEPAAFAAALAPLAIEPRSPDPPTTPLYISFRALRN
jgi:hypothetical protein